MALMNLGASPPSLTEQAVDQCQDYAHGNVYMGLTLSGDTYSGWPIDDLVNTVLPNVAPSFKAIVALTLKNRWKARGLLPGAQAARPPSFPSNREMLSMRMRWHSWAEGFEHIDVHQQGDKVHIWIIMKDGQSKVLEDEGSLFPSDAIVTKLNMLKGT